MAIKNKLELICEKWAPNALEYMKFLARNGIQTVAIVSGKVDIGSKIAIYADEEQYLNLSIQDEAFNQAEEQLNEILNAVEMLVELVSSLLKEEYEYNKEYYDDEFEDALYQNEEGDII